MSTIRTKAYIPSASEYDKYFKKFRAFMGAKLSKKAAANGVWESPSYEGKGYYALRTPLSSDSIFYGNFNGTRDYDVSFVVNAGLRVAFQLIYKPESSIVKGCQEIEQQSLIFDDNAAPVYTKYGQDKEVTSKAPIVKFGGHDCIWLNKEECENGTAKTMELWTLELIDKAVPFDRRGNHNDYAKATELQNQCYQALTENCSEEEKAMLVEVEMSSEYKYEIATTILEIKNKLDDEEQMS